MKAGPVRVLLIAYYLPPDKRVGALRAGYWMKNLERIAPVSLSVITAEEQAQGKQVYVVPVQGTSMLSKLIKDAGLVWKKNIRAFLEKKKDLYPDVVIITGSPFMQFGLTAWLKKKYACKVVLDYRDPFATNPFFDNSFLKIAVKRFFEKRFNREADGLITVNKYCGELIAGFFQKPHSFIQNGYDDTIKVECRPVSLTEPDFVYTGKFYFDTDPLIQALSAQSLKLNHAGDQVEKLAKLPAELLNATGLVPYEQALQLIGSSDVGVVQTSGEDHISTTKLFDYMRCGRPILVISEGKLNSASISEELKGYPNVFWAHNETSAIEAAIEKIRTSGFTPPDPAFAEPYSRFNQMKKLWQFIETLPS